MYRNVVYSGRDQTVSLFTWNESGERVTQRYPFKPYLYVKSDSGVDGVSIYNEKLSKVSFKTKKSREKFTQNNKNVYYDLPPETQFLIEKFGGENKSESFSSNQLKTFYLDIEVYCKKYHDNDYIVSIRKNGDDEGKTLTSKIGALRSSEKLRNKCEVWDEETKEWLPFKVSCYNESSGFPDPHIADKPINLITVLDSLTNVYHTFGTKPYHGDGGRDNLIYHYHADEFEMIKAFVKFWRKDFPDIVTGWNCLNVNEHIWMPDKITKLSNISKDAPLFMSDKVNNYMNTGKKKEYVMQSALGNTIYSSIDHIFPIWYKRCHEYKNQNTLSKKRKDLKLKEILENYKKEDYYLRVEKRKNVNPNLTFKDLLLNNTAKIFNSDVELIIDSVEFKNKIKNLGLCDHLRPEYHQGSTFWKRCPSFWSMSNIINCYPDFDINKYINSVDNIKLKRKNGHIFNLDLNLTISDELLKLMGFVFTDGSLDGDQYAFSSVYESLTQHYLDIYSSMKGKKYSPPHTSNGDDNFYKSININNILGVLHPLIYNSQNKKKLDIELLSQLSESQFSSFYSGLIDGDGFFDPNGMNLCNFDKGYQHNLSGLQELLLWNNVTASLHRNILRISATKYNENFLRGLCISHPKRLEKRNALTYKTKKNSISKKIKFFEFDDHLLVKVDKVEPTGRTVEMADIETTSHYFTCNGIKTHNCDGFDIPYIINRINKLYTENGVYEGKNASDRLSPLGYCFGMDEVTKRLDNYDKLWYIQGVTIFDYMYLYKVFTRERRASYSLNYISEIEIGKNKDEVDKLTLSELADTDWDSFVKYNIQDVRLIKLLEDKLRYIDICRKIGYLSLCPFKRSESTVQVVTGIIAQKALEQGKIIPTFIPDQVDAFKGGFVRDSQTGLQRDILYFDINSLYPNTIVTLNLSPETKIASFVREDDGTVTLKTRLGKIINITDEKFKKLIVQEELCISESNVLFSQKVKGLVPSIIEEIYSERVDIKNHSKKLGNKKVKLSNAIKNDDSNRDSKIFNELRNIEYNLAQDDTMQYVLKILLNKIYGYFAEKSSPFMDLELAESITHTGQGCIKEAATVVNDHINKKYKINKDCVVFGDTDSVGITIHDVLTKLDMPLDINGSINPEVFNLSMSFKRLIDKKINTWAIEKLNSKWRNYEFKLESISSSAIFVKKKNYVLEMICDEDGQSFYDDSGKKLRRKYKYTGLEVVRTTTPNKVKPFLKQIIENIMVEQDKIKVSENIKQMFDDFDSFSVEDIGCPVSLNNYVKYEDKAVGFRIGKGTPIQVKSAIYYNRLLEKHNLQKKYERLRSGDNIKFVLLHKNQLGIKTIAFMHEYPDEFKYLDVDTSAMFEKIVLKPLNRVFTVLGWNIPSPTRGERNDILKMFSD